MIIGLDDCKSWAWNFTFMAKSSQQVSDKRCFSRTEPARQRNHVAALELASESLTKCRCRRFIGEVHCGARGMIIVTRVPLPTADSSPTVPPCASMNWRVSGRPSPSAASPRPTPPML